MFTKLQLDELHRVSMSALLCNNADNIKSVPEDVFVHTGDMNMYKMCDTQVAHINLNLWQVG